MHTFDRAGNYTITLDTKDSGTPSQNASANVVVTIGADVNKTVAQTETVTEALNSLLDANSTNSPVPATIEFAGNATGGLTPYSYNWNFGDGNNSTYFGSKYHMYLIRLEIILLRSQLKTLVLLLRPHLQMW